MIVLIDSIHFKLGDSNQVYSILDLVLAPLDQNMEVTYSAPFSYTRFIDESSVPTLLNYPNRHASIPFIMLESFAFSSFF